MERKVFFSSILSFLLVFILFFFSFVFASSSSSSWIQLNTTSEVPIGRVYSASAGGSTVPPPYEPSDKTGIAIFGGTTNPTTYSPCFNDLWIFNPQDITEGDDRLFTEIVMDSSFPSPAPRALSAIAIDPTTNTLYLYGGYNGTNWFDDLWTTNLTVIHYPGVTSQWIQISTDYSTAPPFLCGMSFVWTGVPEDPMSSTDNLVLFGGGDDKRQLYSETHIWIDAYPLSLTKWEVVPTDIHPVPPAREFHTAFAAYEYNLMYIFGGYDYGYTYFNDTWQLFVAGEGATKSSWLLQNVSVHSSPPPSRCCNALAYSQKSNILLIWGGRDGQSTFSDMWTTTIPAEGLEWTPIDSSSSSSPVPRYGMVSTYWAEKDALLIWGGMDEDGNPLNDMWYYPFPSNS